MELIIITNGFTRFEDVKQLSAYVGVSPTTYSSGSSIKGRGGIAKMGQARMRQRSEQFQFEMVHRAGTEGCMAIT